MAGKPRVQPCNQLDRSAHVFAVELIGIEFTMAEIVIYVPHAVAAGLGDTAEQCRTVFGHAGCGKPASLYQFAALRDLRSQALHNHLTSLAVDEEPQPEDTRRARLQHLLIKHTALCLAATEQLFQ